MNRGVVNCEPWPVLKICGVLSIVNHKDAAGRLDTDEKAEVGITDVSSNGVTQRRQNLIVSESGLWSLVLTSRKPEARRFKKWITAEVIPAIRKTGGYIGAAPQETPEQIMARALVAAQDTLCRQAEDLAAVQDRLRFT